MPSLADLTGGPNGSAMPFNQPTMQTLAVSQANVAPDMLVNYNDRYRTSTPALFRDEILTQMISTLVGRVKPNVLLVGDAGVGKTKIVQELARRIEVGDPTIPPALASSTIMELPISSIVSGASLVGQLEERLQAVIAYAENRQNDVILFMDEIHLLMGSSDTYSKIAQILKPALAAGNLRVIGATTTSESRELMEDPAFSRRFTRLIVPELTNEETFTILKAASPVSAAHYENKVMVTDQILRSTIRIADDYAASGNHRPDTALTLLDRASADTYLKRVAQETSPDPNIRKLAQSVPAMVLTERQLRESAMHIATGFAHAFSFNKAALTQDLASVKGQDAATSEIIEAIARSERNLFPKKRPLSFLLCGASGVGKTMTAKIIAQSLMQTQPVIINMTEYSDHMSMTRLMGSTAGYVGSDSMAEKPLDPLKTNPYQVIVLDEFEKACSEVQRIFMQALDEGKIVDNGGQEIDFSKAIVIATTNANFDRDAHTACGFATSVQSKKASQIDALTPWFDVALLNRFTHIIDYASISKSTYECILQDIYETEASRIVREHPSIKLPSMLSDDELEEIASDSYVPKLGARPARKAIEAWIEEHA